MRRPLRPSAVLLALLLLTAPSAFGQTGEPAAGAPFEAWTAYLIDSAPAELPREPLKERIEAKRPEFDRLPGAEERAALMRRLKLELAGGASGSIPPQAADAAISRRQELAAKNASAIAAALGTSPGPQDVASGGPGRPADALTPRPASGAAPKKGEPPPPGDASIDPRRQRDIETLQAGITPVGRVQPDSIDNGRRALAAMMAETDPEVLHHMAERGFRIFVVGKGGKVTDAPAFETLKGKKSGNQIKYEKAAGIADTDALVIKEEDLRRTTWSPRYSTFAHELGHAVAANLDEEDRARLYLASWKALGAGLDKYALTTPDENIAEATAAFFGVGRKDKNAVVRMLSSYIGGGWLNGKGQYKRLDAEGLRKDQPELYARLEAIYGRPRDIGR